MTKVEIEEEAKLERKQSAPDVLDNADEQPIPETQDQEEIKKPEVPKKSSAFPSPFFQGHNIKVKRKKSQDFKNSAPGEETINEDSINKQIQGLDMESQASNQFLDNQDETISNASGEKGAKVIMEEPDFKFVLYASFMSENESVGLPLCRMLQKINAVAGLNNFELNLRFSLDEQGKRIKKQSRWDQTFIKDSLTRIAKVN